MNYRELWLDVVCGGECTDSENGFGAGAGWVFRSYELNVEGQLFRAEDYITEFRSARDLFVFSEVTEEWAHVWGEALSN